MTQFSVVHGDVLEVPADMLLLKFATEHYGVDDIVSRRLVSTGACRHRDTCPEPGSCSIVPTEGRIAPDRVMFLATPSLIHFQYDEMRAFARDAIQHLAETRRPVTTITTTIHGARYGLDAGEALQSLVLGFTQGLMQYPDAGIRLIKFVDTNHTAVRLLQRVLGALGAPIVGTPPSPRAREQDTTVPATEQLSLAGASLSDSTITLGTPVSPRQSQKEHIFVAMPFTEEFEDVYEYGIYGPVRKCGYICEKVDQASFAGDILERIRQRISTAKIVIADLSDARPNVYLEVGYAWGMNVPVIFLARAGQELHFDVQTHRCVFYKTIRQLARELEILLRNLDSD